MAEASWHSDLIKKSGNMEIHIAALNFNILVLV